MTVETMTTYQGFYAGSIADPAAFWSRQAKLIDWRSMVRKSGLICVAKLSG